MTNFQSCARRWWYHYVAHAPDEHVGSSLLFGGSIHAALEHVHKAQQRGEPANRDAIFAEFEDHWRQGAANQEVKFNKGESEQQLFELGRALLRDYLTEHLPNLDGLAGVEERIELQVPGLSVPVIGRIDVRLVDDESVTVIDAKTSKTAFNVDKLVQATAQLALYSAAQIGSAEQSGKRIAGRFIVFRKLKHPRIEIVDVDLGASDLNRTLRMLRDTWALIEAAYAARSFPINPSWQCKLCPFRNRCLRDSGQSL
jgi:CRISPR/Cas system-associated exonuclease Cas4 (RecB family)